MITLKHLPDGSHSTPHFTAEAVIPTPVPPLPNPPRAPRPAEAREGSGSLSVLTEEARKVREKKNKRPMVPSHLLQPQACNLSTSGFAVDSDIPSRKSVIIPARTAALPH